MDHGGPCIPLNRFRGTSSNTIRLSALKKISPSPSTEVVEFDPSSRFVTPGSSGGTFSARGQLVAVTLPSLHNDYYVPTRASKKQPITTQRFLPDKNVIITPGIKLSTRERLRIENELLEEAKQRNRMTQLIPHRAQQPYLMAGFPITLQERAASGTPPTDSTRHTAALLPPQSSLVEPEAQSKAGQTADQSAISLPGQSYASDTFLTQTTLDPIIGMDEITVRQSQFNNYRSPCSLLGRDKVNTLSAEFKKIAQDLVTLGYSHAEQLVEDCKDPSHAVQVKMKKCANLNKRNGQNAWAWIKKVLQISEKPLHERLNARFRIPVDQGSGEEGGKEEEHDTRQVLDLNGDGFVDIKEYIVVMALSQHYFSGSDIFFDQDKVEAKIKHLKGKFDELETPSLQASLHGFSRLLISDGLMSDTISALNCDPISNLTFSEYICIFMFWEELEDIILEQDLSGDIEISSYITAYLGASDSTFSFDEALSSTFLDQ